MTSIYGVAGLILAILSRSFTVRGLQFGESDIYVTEGASPREVFIKRTYDVSNSLKIYVYAATIEDYKQRSHTRCNCTLTDLGVNESNVDPAERADFIHTLFNITFESGNHFASFNFEIDDDDIAEDEEVLILYTDYIESSNDHCAIAVNLLDNDRSYFSFSNDSIIVWENVGVYSNVTVVRTGKIEPNIIIKVDIHDVQNIKGKLFDLNENPLVFTNDVETQELTINIYDNNNLNGEHYFLLNLQVCNDVKYAVVSPDSLTVYIRDDEVAMIGYKNKTNITIEEGTEIAKICIGFDSSMEGINISEDAFFTLKVISTSLLPSVYGLLVPQTELYIDRHHREQCFNISSYYDVNLDDSLYELTFNFSLLFNLIQIQLTHPFVNVNVSDQHGIEFLSEPSDQKVKMTSEAFFPCTFKGTDLNPLWNITYSNGIFELYSTTRLPFHMYPNEIGLIVKILDENQNLSSYSCFHHAYDKQSISTVSSSAGVLIIEETVTFRFVEVWENMTLSDDFQLDAGLWNPLTALIEGMYPPDLKVVKTGYLSDIVHIDLVYKLENFPDFNYIQRNACKFNDSVNECTVSIPLEDELKEDNILENMKEFKVTMAAGSLETLRTTSGAYLNFADHNYEPLIIRIYDNDFRAGFTNLEAVLTMTMETNTTDICLMIFDWDENDVLHSSFTIDLSLQVQPPNEVGLILNATVVTLDAKRRMQCVSVTATNFTMDCDHQQNTTVITKWNSQHRFNVTLLQPNITVITQFDANCSEKMNIEGTDSIAAVIAVFLVILMVLCLIVLMCCCCKMYNYYNN